MEEKLLLSWNGAVCQDGVTIISDLKKGREVRWCYRTRDHVVTGRPEWAAYVSIYPDTPGETVPRDVRVSRRLSRQAALKLAELADKLRRME